MAHAHVQIVTLSDICQLMAHQTHLQGRAQLCLTAAVLMIQRADLQLLVLPAAGFPGMAGHIGSKLPRGLWPVFLAHLIGVLLYATPCVCSIQTAGARG